MREELLEPSIAIYGAFHDEDMVGCATVRPTPTPFQNVYGISMVGVAPTHHRKGVASSLV